MAKDQKQERQDMALSVPVERTLFHQRQVQCTGYYREDGLWDIEGQIVDTKSYSLEFYDGRQLPPGEALHEMTLRLTLDHHLLIHAAEAFTAHAPFPICPEINAAYQQLVGIKIGPGFNQKVRDLFKGRGGCTHITELLGPMATTAIQTISNGQRHLAQTGVAQQKPTLPASRLIDTCYGWRSDGEPVAVQFPELYTGPHR
jgi:hypothetical protein